MGARLLGVWVWAAKCLDVSCIYEKFQRKTFVIWNNNRNVWRKTEKNHFKIQTKMKNKKNPKKFVRYKDEWIEVEMFEWKIKWRIKWRLGSMSASTWRPNILGFKLPNVSVFNVENSHSISGLCLISTMEFHFSFEFEFVVNVPKNNNRFRRIFYFSFPE